MWNELLINPKAIKMFHSPPSLKKVVLSRMSLDHEGPSITLCVQTRDYPNHPPARWRMREHDAVMIELEAMGVTHVEINGWNTVNEVAIEVERQLDGCVALAIVGEGVKIDIRCGWLRVVNVNPYLWDSERT